MYNDIQILSCNSNLGNCCKDATIKSIMSSTNAIISLIQIIVPILLLVMVTIELTKLMMNPDDKKKLSSIKNKAIAAFVIFFIPLFVNVTINIMSDSGNASFDFASCLEETKNIKVNTRPTYKSINPERRKNIYSNPDDYEKGEERKPDSSSSSSETVGTNLTSNSCSLGDSNVKLVPNDSKKIDSVVKKANGQAVADYAKSWVGKMSYEYYATGAFCVGGTCSCSHFVYEVLQHFGILDGGLIRSTVWGSCGVKGTVMYSDYSKLVPGDVVFKSFGNAVGHVEIYIGNGETIGCNSGRGVTHDTHAGNYTSYIHLTAYD